MRKSLLSIIIIFTFLTCCKGKIEENNSNFELTEIEKDSTLQIVEKICGEWKVDKKIKQDFSLNGIALGPTVIDCLVDIDTKKLVNEIIISESFYLSEINAEVPESIDSLFLPASDSIIISKEREYYGLKYAKEKNIPFIPIKSINDSILLLVDGRKYERVN